MSFYLCLYQTLRFKTLTYALWQVSLAVHGPGVAASQQRKCKSQRDQPGTVCAERDHHTEPALPLLLPLFHHPDLNQPFRGGSKVELN